LILIDYPVILLRQLNVLEELALLAVLGETEVARRSTIDENGIVVLVAEILVVIVGNEMETGMKSDVLLVECLVMIVLFVVVAVVVVALVVVVDAPVVDAAVVVVIVVVVFVVDFVCFQ